MDITVAYPEGKPLDLPTIIMGQRRPCRTHMYYRLFPSSAVRKYLCVLTTLNYHTILKQMNNFVFFRFLETKKKWLNGCLTVGKKRNVFWRRSILLVSFLFTKGHANQQLSSRTVYGSLYHMYFLLHRLMPTIDL